MVSGRLLWCVTCPNHASFRFLTFARSGSCGPARKLVVGLLHQVGNSEKFSLGQQGKELRAVICLWAWAQWNKSCVIDVINLCYHSGTAVSCVFVNLHHVHCCQVLIILVVSFSCETWLWPCLFYTKGSNSPCDRNVWWPRSGEWVCDSHSNFKALHLCSLWLPSPPPLTKFVGHIGITASMCLYFVQMISPELLNFLLPNLVWWYIILSRSVLQKNWSIFKVKVTARAYIFQIWLFLPYLLNLICLQPNLVWW